MLKYIIKREILDNLLSLRFSLTLILIVIVMTMSSLLFISDHKKAESAYAMSLQENRRQLEQWFKSSSMPWTLWVVFSFNDQKVYKKPSDFAFLADGYDKELPNTFKIRPFEISGPNVELRTNPVLQTFEVPDWSMVIGIIMSFAAIVLTYDVISGDRERGTLKLTMSNPVPRAIILLGKYIGTLVSLLIPLLIGILLNIIIIAVSGVVTLDGSAWVRIGMVSLLSLLYIAGFVSLGIFVSGAVRESATSLIILLLSWAVMVIVVPGVGGVIDSKIVKIPSQEAASIESMNAWKQARDKYLAQYPEMRGIAFGSGHWSPGENLAGPLAAEEARNDVLERYGDAIVRQIRSGQNMIRVSPLGLYKNGVEVLAGTGMIHYDSFMKQVRQYRRILKGVMMDKYPLDPNKAYRDRLGDNEFKMVMDKVEFKSSDIPEFHEKPIVVGDAVKATIWNIFFLSLFLLIFFMGSVVVFLRYDVR